MRDLAGRTALVTGASRGLGPYIARALARERMHLVLAARSAAELEQVAVRLRADGARATAVPTDVADRRALAALVAAAEREFGTVDVLVNNAGILLPWSYHRMDPAEIERAVQVNLVAAMLLARLVLPGMLDRRRGHIVNISSLAGKAPPPYTEPYAATKAGLVGFTAALRLSYRGTGVSASVVCPGFVRQAGMYQVLRETTGITAPGFLGTSTPEDVGRAVVRAVRRDLPQVIVNPVPMRALLAARELFPVIAGWIPVDTFRRAAAVYERGATG